MHELAFPLLVGLILLALAFDFLNGLHDAANSIATVVATRLLRPVQAVVFAAFFGFLVAAACGYMAGLVGSSASPISGIGIIATIASRMTVTTMSTGRRRAEDGVVDLDEDEWSRDGGNSDSPWSGGPRNLPPEPPSDERGDRS